MEFNANKQKGGLNLTKNKYGHDDIEYIIAEYKDMLENADVDMLNKKVMIREFIDILEKLKE